MGEDVLPEKRLLEEATTIKRFEYSALGSEFLGNILGNKIKD